MAHYNTILSQITSLIPRHFFEHHADIHHSGQRFRSFNRWSQFMAMPTGQLSGRKSLLRKKRSKIVRAVLDEERTSTHE